jgi:hypothetical protein
VVEGGKEKGGKNKEGKERKGKERKGKEREKWGERGFWFVCRMICGIKEIEKVG